MKRRGAQTVRLKEAKTVSAEHLAVRTIRRRIGWVLAASQAPHVPTRHMMSVCPQAGHGNNPPGNSVFDAVAAMVQGVGYLELPTPLM